jgi:predicted nucleic acid-binding protein
VVFETIALARMRAGHRLAVEAGNIPYSEKMARIHSATLEEEKSAFAYLARHEDKSYSAVDCLSFVVMERLGIREALAVDRHFTHRFLARPIAEVTSPPGPGEKFGLGGCARGSERCSTGRSG